MGRKGWGRGGGEGEKERRRERERRVVLERWRVGGMGVKERGHPFRLLLCHHVVGQAPDRPEEPV